MRIRNKSWVGEELASCPFVVKKPFLYRGSWRFQYPHPENPFMVELGCGKGDFISRYAREHPEVNFLASDKIDKILGVAKRTVETVYGLEPRQIPGNLLLANVDAEQIGGVFDESDRVDRLFIHFCNPWPKDRHRKRRLTSPRLLRVYRSFLAPGAELWFKTDDDGLFSDTIGCLEQSGYEVLFQTADLCSVSDRSVILPESEHEKMFRERGIPIKFLRACPEPLYDDLVIEPFHDADASELSAMITETLHRINSRDYSMDEIERVSGFYTPQGLAELSKDAALLIARKNNRIVGSAGLRGNEVFAVFTDPDFQGKGIGRKLMYNLEKNAKSQGIKTLFLGSSVSAAGFYYGIGWRYRNGIKILNENRLYEMEKVLIDSHS